MLMLKVDQNDLKTLVYLLLHSGLPGKELMYQLTEFTYLILTQDFEPRDPEALKKLIRNDLISLLYQIAKNEILTYPEVKFVNYLRNRLIRITMNALCQCLIEYPVYLGSLNIKEDITERFLFHTKQEENGKNGKKRSFNQKKTIKREQELMQIMHFHPGVLFKKEKKLQQLRLL